MYDTVNYDELTTRRAFQIREAVAGNTHGPVRGVSQGTLKQALQRCAELQATMKARLYVTYPDQPGCQV